MNFTLHLPVWPGRGNQQNNRPMSSQRSWRERHPFLYGMSQTFGIFPVRRRVESVQESFERVAEAISEAEREAKGREMWWIGARRIHVLGFIAWTGPYRSEADAQADVPLVQAKESKRNGSYTDSGCISYVFVERDDDVEDAGEYLTPAAPTEQPEQK